MSRKLRRGRTRVFHKRNTLPLKILGWVLAAAVIVAGGYFGAKFILEEKPATESSSPASGQPASSVPSSSQPPASEPEVTTPEAGALRAFYLPLSALRQTETLPSVLDEAAAAGFNAVLFDLKDEAGNLLYASATELALEAQSAADDAMSLDELKSLFQTLRGKGFVALPRLYAFVDAVAPRQLSTAKITTVDHPTWTWYDGDPNNGGKPWLNPYSPVAHQYLTDLLAELKEAGADTVMLDGVQFPKQTKDANFGDGEYASQSKAEVLTTFVSKAVAAMDGGRVLLASPGLAALGNDTTVYGGNPLTFGASAVAPIVMPSTLGNRLTAGTQTVDNPAANPFAAVSAALAQMQLRLQVIEQDMRPDLVPWLQGYDCTTAEMNEQIRAVTEVLGDDASYILYNPAGTYDFSALS